MQLDGNPELKDLFSQVGITESQLQQDKDLTKFVKDFIQQSGGLDAVKRDREREKARPPPVPPSIPQAPQSQLPPPPAVPPLPVASNVTQLICIANRFSRA